MSQVLLTRKRKHIAERGTARKLLGFGDLKVRPERALCGAGRPRSPECWGCLLLLPTAAVLSEWCYAPYALPPIPKDGKGIIILREHCAKIFFFLEFLERLLDSSKYSFKSHWSICYSATVIAAGGGRFLTRCTHARTQARTRRPGTAIFQCQGRAAPAVWSLYLIIWSWGLWLILLRASKTTPPPLLVYYL